MLDNSIPIDNQKGEEPTSAQKEQDNTIEIPVGTQAPGAQKEQDNTTETPADVQSTKEDASIQLNARIQELEQEVNLNNEKAVQLDTLTGDADFQNFLINRHNQLQESQQVPTVPAELDVNFDEYEGGEAFERLGNAVSKNVAGQLDALRKEFAQQLAPMQEMISGTKSQSEWTALINTAQQQGWDDPQKYKKSIDFTLQKYPGMSMVDAYDIVKGSMSRRPIAAATVQSAAGQQPQVPTVKPGGTSVVTNPIATSVDNLEAAQQARKEGKPRRSITELLAETTKFIMNK